MSVKFSFIIPTRNEAAYIADCLRSIRAQKRKDYEIIVADTLSSDGTLQLAKRYADKALTEPRRGPAIARNTGARAAKGDILIFADADVRFERDFLDKVDKEFAKHPAVAGGICKLRTYDASSALLARSYNTVNIIVRLLNAAGIAMTAGSCFIFRRAAFERAGGFNPCLFTNEDHDMAQRAAKLGRFVYFGDIPIWTSTRRVEKSGFWHSLITYFRSTAIYALNKSCIRDYW
jgi:glycosyltransferase involved in cell wall biosynthesis